MLHCSEDSGSTDKRARVGPGAKGVLLSVQGCFGLRGFEGGLSGALGKDKDSKYPTHEAVTYAAVIDCCLEQDQFLEAWCGAL